VAETSPCDERLVCLLGGTPFLYLREELGEGAAGRVFAVGLSPELLPRYGYGPMAAKFYKPEILKHRDEQIRVTREATIGAAIRHDNIVQVFGFFDTDFGPCILMERVIGTTLRELLTTSKSHPVRQWSSQLLSGLATLHRNGVIHRDIKPENLLVTEDLQQLKIADFGVAKPIPSTRITETSEFLGTLRYSAPEYLFDGRSSYQSDQFSAGCVIHELYLHEPFVKAEGTFASQALRIKRNRPRLRGFPVTRVGDLVRKRVLVKLLSPVAGQRFGDTSEALEAFSSDTRSNWWVRYVRTRSEELGDPRHTDLQNRCSAKKRIYFPKVESQEFQFRKDLVRKEIERLKIPSSRCPACGEQTLLMDCKVRPATIQMYIFRCQDCTTITSVTLQRSLVDLTPLAPVCENCGSSHMLLENDFAEGFSNISNPWCELCFYEMTNEEALWYDRFAVQYSDPSSDELIVLASVLEGTAELPSTRTVEKVIKLRKMEMP
jgi:serine/threonine protein kinase